MYFNLPTCTERKDLQRHSSSSIPTDNNSSNNNNNSNITNNSSSNNSNNSSSNNSNNSSSNNITHADATHPSFDLHHKLTETAGVADERILEIVNNLQEHWGSPPIMTPETLAYVFNNQWMKEHPFVLAEKPQTTDPETVSR
ncbi:hypothetical protein BDF14DRAFT_1838705 [Spinellus fusiger]|nr:hypothetical protein BDF14DRAFT_1838705 [Spinellus fusiger]